MEQLRSVDYHLKWFVMAAVSMGIFLATIDGSIVNIALPTLVKELNSDFTTIQWVVLGYLLTITTLMLSIGRWADMVGKKRIYVWGFVIFTLGSLACGVSTNVFMLITFRVIQAIGAAMMMALGMAIVTENFPPSERGKALGITGLIVSIGIIAGPTMGGLILGSFSWHWIFFVNLPVGIAGIVMVIKFVPDVIPGIRQKFDFPGAVSLFVSLICLLFALTVGEVDGFLTLPVLLLTVGFILFLVVFIRVESNSPQPMVDLALFRNTLFSTNLITGAITFVASSGTVILMPFYLENLLQYSPRMVGILMAVVPVAMGIFSPISGVLSDKWGPKALTLAGMAMLLIGYIGVATLTLETSAWGYVLRFLPVGIGMGIFQSPNNSAIMSAAPRDRLGVASGLLSLTRTLGQITGIATLGAIWSARIISRSFPVPVTSSSEASPFIQVLALSDTMIVVVVLLALGITVSIWTWYKERSLKQLDRVPQ
jgi:EmrB/QacA subfamily drug resistance transporter